MVLVASVAVAATVLAAVVLAVVAVVGGVVALLERARGGKTPQGPRSRRATPTAAGLPWALSAIEAALHGGARSSLPGLSAGSIACGGGCERRRATLTASGPAVDPVAESDPYVAGMSLGRRICSRV